MHEADIPHSLYKETWLFNNLFRKSFLEKNQSAGNEMRGKGQQVLFFSIVFTEELSSNAEIAELFI